MAPTSGKHGQRRRRTLATRPVLLVVLAAVLVTGAAAGVTAKLAAHDSAHCQNAFIPAFFYADSGWARAIDSKPAPSVMILDITSTGAGSAPVPHFQDLVKRVHAAGVTVLGYSATQYGHRPAAQVESDIQNYKAWYGVNGIFLDQASSSSGDLGYYRNLASYIHGTLPGSKIWLNPGSYPDERYMSVGDVVMVFEGTYAQYRDLRVPGWASHYAADRFAHTIYAASGSELSSAISLSRSRNAGYLFVTNGSGANPYGAMPSYWSTENAAVSTGCASTGPATNASVQAKPPPGEQAAHRIFTE